MKTFVDFLREDAPIITFLFIMLLLLIIIGLNEFSFKKK